MSTDGYPQDKSFLKYRKKSLGSKVDIAVRVRKSRLGLVKETTTATSGEEADPASKVGAEVSRLCEVEPSTLGTDITTEDALAWWQESEHALSLLARASRVAVGAPASSAILERDISVGGRLVSSSRISTDTVLWR